MCLGDQACDPSVVHGDVQSQQAGVEVLDLARSVGGKVGHDSTDPMINLGRVLSGGGCGCLIAEVGDREGAVFVQWEARIVGNLRDVSVRIEKGPGIAAVDSVGWRAGHRRACIRSRCDDGVDVGSVVHVVGQRDAAESSCRHVVDTGVLREFVSAPQHDTDAAGLEEHRLVHRLAMPAELGVEGARTFDVGHTKCHQAQSLFHDALPQVRR